MTTPSLEACLKLSGFNLQRADSQLTVSNEQVSFNGIPSEDARECLQALVLGGRAASKIQQPSIVTVMFLGKPVIADATDDHSYKFIYSTVFLNMLPQLNTLFREKYSKIKINIDFKYISLEHDANPVITITAVTKDNQSRGFALELLGGMQSVFTDVISKLLVVISGMLNCDLKDCANTATKSSIGKSITVTLIK